MFKTLMNQLFCCITLLVHYLFCDLYELGCVVYKVLIYSFLAGEMCFIFI